MKSEINKELIKGLAEGNNQAFLEGVNNMVYNLVSAAVEAISEKSAFVVPEKCILIPVNEICTGAFTQLSTCDYFLGIENTQIEMNTKMHRNIWKYMWREFKGVPQELQLPHAPKQFIYVYTEAEEPTEPQIKTARAIDGGMAISCGRLRESTQYDYKMVSMSHNTLRGAAGGALLLAELLTAKGYMD